MKRPKYDVLFEDHGTIALLTPQTDAGREWIETRLDTEPWQWLGRSLTIESRYAIEIMEGMEVDGLYV